MRVLVSGADGYIGGACVRSLARSGWSVRAACRGRLVSACAESVQVGTIDGQTPWAQHLEGVDTVLHLAGVAHKPDTEAASYRRVNVDGTRQLAQAAAAAGVRRFVFVSSIAVYGCRVAAQPLDETTPVAPGDHYGQSKADAEAAIAQVCDGRSMEWTVVRPPLVYGPGAPGNFRRLVGLVRSGIPLPLAAATAPRSYMGLDNLVSALECAARHPDAAKRTFVLSDGQDVSTAQLIRWIAEGLGCRARLWWLPERLLRAGAALVGRAGDASRLLDPLRVDSRRFRQTLRWQPPVSVEDGVRCSVASERSA